MEPEVAIIPKLNPVALILRITMLIWLVAISIITMVCGATYIIKTSKFNRLNYFNGTIWLGITIGPFITLIWAISTGKNY